MNDLPEVVYRVVRVFPEGHKRSFYQTSSTRLYGRLADVGSFKKASPATCTHKVWKATVTWEEVE